MTHSLTILVCQAQWKPVKVGKKLNFFLLFLAYLCEWESHGNWNAEGVTIHFNTHPESDIWLTKTKKQQQQKATLFFSRLQPITSLSRTNYAECKCRSPSNGLCCRGLLEGRSFIPFSTSICPRGFCSSVARRVSLLCLFICCAPTSGCVSDCGGEREKECKSVWRKRCVLRLRVVIYAVYLCTHMQDFAACAVSQMFVLHVHRSRNARFSFRAISKVLNCFPQVQDAMPNRKVCCSVWLYILWKLRFRLMRKWIRHRRFKHRRFKHKKASLHTPRCHIASDVWCPDDTGPVCLYLKICG